MYREWLYLYVDVAGVSCSKAIEVLLDRSPDIRGVAADVEWCTACYDECMSSKYLPVGLRLPDR
jgi:hypothetical protein